jgi:hypothetical protein
MLTIPTTWESEVGGSWSEAGLSKSTRPYLKKLKQKKVEGMAQVVLHSLLSVRAWIQTPVLAPDPQIFNYRACHLSLFIHRSLMVLQKEVRRISLQKRSLMLPVVRALHLPFVFLLDCISANFFFFLFRYHFKINLPVRTHFIQEIHSWTQTFLGKRSCLSHSVKSV